MQTAERPEHASSTDASESAQAAVSGDVASQYTAGLLQPQDSAEQRRSSSQMRQSRDQLLSPTGYILAFVPQPSSALDDTPAAPTGQVANEQSRSSAEAAAVSQNSNLIPSTSDHQAPPAESAQQASSASPTHDSIPPSSSAQPSGRPSQSTESSQAPSKRDFASTSSYHQSTSSVLDADSLTPNSASSHPAESQQAQHAPGIPNEPAEPQQAQHTPETSSEPLKSQQAQHAPQVALDASQAARSAAVKLLIAFMGALQASQFAVDAFVTSTLTYYRYAGCVCDKKQCIVDCCKGLGYSHTCSASLTVCSRCLRDQHLDLLQVCCAHIRLRFW